MPMSPGTPLGERDPRDPCRALHVGERARVLDLDPEQQLAVRVERPGIRSGEVLVDRDPPDLRRTDLAAVSAAPGTEIGAGARGEGVARRLHERAYRFRRFGMAQKQAVDAGGEHLLDHPSIRADRLLVRPVHRERHDHCGCPVPAPRGTAVGEPMHELHQPAHVEGAVLHVVGDVVRPRLRQRAPSVVLAGADAVDELEVHRLTLLQQLDRFVDTPHGPYEPQRCRPTVSSREYTSHDRAAARGGIRWRTSGLISDIGHMPLAMRTASSPSCVWARSHATSE